MKNRVWRLLPALVLPFLVLANGAVGSAQVVPDEATIREKIRAARGAVIETYRETDEIVRSNGSTTIEHDFVRGKDYHYLFDTGPFHREDGVYRGEGWHMNDNGQVIVDEADPGQAVAETTAARVTAIHAPVEGFMLATLNARGHGTKEYVDGSTWYIVRRDAVTPNGTIVSTYDDIREDHGRTFPHHVHVDDGYARTSSDLRVTEYQPGHVAESDVAIPKPRRALVNFPADQAPVVLPARFSNGDIFVRVNVGDRGLDFVLDSGAGEITIDTDIARQLGLPEYPKESAVTVGRYTTHRTIVPEMRIGNLVMHNVAVQVFPQGWHNTIGLKAIGLLGFDFLAELGVTIDYEHERVTVVPSSAYAPPTDPKTFWIDLRIGDSVPMATVKLNGAIGERWVIDTGGAGTFMILDHFARRHPEALKDRGGGGYLRNYTFSGIGGDIPATPYQISSLKLGNINFVDFVGYRVTDSKVYADDSDGIIGTDFLKMFTVGFDYANSRLYLVPNTAGRKAMGIK